MYARCEEDLYKYIGRSQILVSPPCELARVIDPSMNTSHDFNAPSYAATSASVYVNQLNRMEQLKQKFDNRGAKKLTMRILAENVDNIKVPEPLLKPLSMDEPQTMNVNRDKVADLFDHIVSVYSVNSEFVEVETSADFETTLKVSPHSLHYPWYRRIGMKGKLDNWEHGLKEEITPHQESIAKFPVTYREGEMGQYESYNNVNDDKYLRPKSQTRIKKTRVHTERMIVGNVMVKRKVCIELPFRKPFLPLDDLPHHHLKEFNRMVCSWYIESIVFPNALFRIAVRPISGNTVHINIEMEHENLLMRQFQCADDMLTYLKAFSFAAQTLAHYYAEYFATTVDINQIDVYHMMDMSLCQKQFLYTCERQFQYSYERI